MLSLSLLHLGCQTTASIPEFHVAFTRPANQDGMRVNVLTGKYYIIPKDEWNKRLRKAIVLELEDWQVIKKALYQPCISYECSQTLNLISGAFETLDQAVGKLPF